MPHFLMIGSTELILIVAVVLLLFGGRKIPELMRGLGKGVRSFKDGLQETSLTSQDESGREGKQAHEKEPPAQE